MYHISISLWNKANIIRELETKLHAIKQARALQPRNMNYMSKYCITINFCQITPKELKCIMVFHKFSSIRHKITAFPHSMSPRINE